MVWQGKRRVQLPRNWAVLRKARLELDGYRCTALVAGEPVTHDGRVYDQIREAIRCPAPATEVHHAVHRDDHRISSLRSVCAYHHQLETQAEAQAAKKPRKRPVAPHPGLR